jgi:hypothetical protein
VQFCVTPSSIAPLQLSSIPLHVSALAVPGVHAWTTPPTQLAWVRWQYPTPHVVEPRFSSVWPLQLSSMPLQT